jgi:hypothetical protein
MHVGFGRSPLRGHGVQVDCQVYDTVTIYPGSQMYGMQLHDQVTCMRDPLFPKTSPHTQSYCAALRLPPSCRYEHAAHLDRTDSRQPTS